MTIFSDRVVVEKYPKMRIPTLIGLGEVLSEGGVDLRKDQMEVMQVVAMWYDG